MIYKNFTFLYPPRPEIAISNAALALYESRGWLAQFKKNGTNTLLAIPPTGDLIIRTRHNTAHKAWSLPDDVAKSLRTLFPEKKWTVLCAELLHSKTVTIKDTLFIYDIVVFNSKHLYRSTFSERHKILDDRLKTKDETKTHYVCDNSGKIWYAKVYTSGFVKLFSGITDPTIDEGLVLKNPLGVLSSCASAKDNSGWQVKCRYPTKNYSF